jgi:formylglycine-generating enzyme required for sulfatase activity
MVVVPAGHFMRQSLADDKKYMATIRQPFAVGKFVVTFNEWKACVASGRCDGYQPKDEGWGQGTRPVINVSWDDAKQYVAWIVELTGKPYRLLTEAEWEYAARAGRTTTYPWSDDIGKGKANCHGCGGDNMMTMPVGSFEPNDFNLHDMQGNVWEWVEDCWHEGYRLAPLDGSAWTKSCTNGSTRVLRGGSWHDEPLNVRPAARWYGPANGRFNDRGFRLARTLNP